MTSIVLLSGGMDSCVTLAKVLADGFEVAALHVNYGQRTQDRELRAFNEICDHYQITNRLVVDISHLAQIGGSSLTDSKMEVPVAPETWNVEPDVAPGTRNVEQESLPLTPHHSPLPNTYVPFRNANILAIATSWAEVIGAETIAIGAVEEDSSGYPDCRESFFRAFEEVIALGSSIGSRQDMLPGTDSRQDMLPGRLRILTPLIHLTKSEIATLGSQLNAPFHLSWSCYKNTEQACGECDSCRLRLRGFQGAGITDPIPYQTGR